MRIFTFPGKAFGVATLAAALILGTHLVAGLDLAAKGGKDRHVKMLDACDADFNIFIGPGTCSRDHGTPFLEFIGELVQTGTAHKWRYDPDHDKVEMGDTIIAMNKGGEVHTFTEVDEFGGGVVQDLNDIVGVFDPALLVPRPECLALDPFGEDFVLPGGTDEEVVTATNGVVKFQCCIHPWMQYLANLKKKK